MQIREYLFASIKSPYDVPHLKNPEISEVIRKAISGTNYIVQPTVLRELQKMSATVKNSAIILTQLCKVFDEFGSHPIPIYKALIILYSCLKGGTDAFFKVARTLVPEIQTVLYLSFNHKRVTFREQIHKLARAIYEYLMYDVPLPDEVDLNSRIPPSSSNDVAYSDSSDDEEQPNSQPLPFDVHQMKRANKTNRLSYNPYSQTNNDQTLTVGDDCRIPNPYAMGRKESEVSQSNEIISNTNVQHPMQPVIPQPNLAQSLQQNIQPIINPNEPIIQTRDVQQAIASPIVPQPPAESPIPLVNQPQKSNIATIPVLTNITPRSMSPPKQPITTVESFFKVHVLPPPKNNETTEPDDPDIDQKIKCDDIKMSSNLKLITKIQYDDSIESC